MSEHKTPPGRTPTAKERDELVKLDLPAGATFEDAARVLLAVKPEDIRPDGREGDDGDRT